MGEVPSSKWFVCKPVLMCILSMHHNSPTMQRLHSTELSTMPVPGRTITILMLPLFAHIIHARRITHLSLAFVSFLPLNHPLQPHLRLLENNLLSPASLTGLLCLSVLVRDPASASSHFLLRRVHSSPLQQLRLANHFALLAVPHTSAATPLCPACHL